MLGNENIASKPRAGRALPPRCHFSPHAGVENKAAEKGRSADRSCFRCFGPCGLRRKM